MAWYFIKKIFAVGWDNGELLVWNEYDYELYELFFLYKISIIVFGWSLAGIRFLFGDKVKIWNIWDLYYEIYLNILKSYKQLLKLCFYNFKRESKEGVDL